MLKQTVIACILEGLKPRQTDFFKKSFTFKGIQDWNCLQSDVRTTINYNTFTKHLQTANGRLVTVFLMFVFTRDIVWSFGLLYVDLAIVCLCTCIVCLAGLPGRPAFC